MISRFLRRISFRLFREMELYRTMNDQIRETLRLPPSRELSWYVRFHRTAGLYAISATQDHRRALCDRIHRFLSPGENFHAYVGDPTVNKDRCIADSWRTTADVRDRNLRPILSDVRHVTCRAFLRPRVRPARPGRLLYRARRSSITHARISIASTARRGIDLGFSPDK